MNTHAILTSARLTLRVMTRVDASFMRALLNDPGFLANIGDRGVRSDADAERYIVDRIRASYVREGFGFYVVAERGDPIGICGFVRRDGLPAPDLGFAFLRSHVGRGYGFEAATAVLGYGDEVLRLDPVLAVTRPANAASIGLLLRLGFVGCDLIDLPGITGPSRLFQRASPLRVDGLGAAGPSK